MSKDFSVVEGEYRARGAADMLSLVERFRAGDFAQAFVAVIADDETEDHTPSVMTQVAGNSAGLLYAIYALAARLRYDAPGNETTVIADRIRAICAEELGFAGGRVDLKSQDAETFGRSVQ